MESLKPGFCTDDELWNINEKRMKRFIDNNIRPFLFVNRGYCCCDIGEANPKMEYLKKVMRINVSQIMLKDLNFSSMPIGRKFDIIFALDVIEHLQNPLWFVTQLEKILKDDGRIYAAMPYNPMWLWVKGHYFEMSPRRFEKWIVIPAGLWIMRKKSFIFTMDWRAIFVGIRPLIRVLTGEKEWQSLIRPLWYRWVIYEIRK